MSEEHVDDELRGLGMAALHENEVSVSDAETESALRAVRERLSSEGGAMSLRRPRLRTRPWWGLLAAAAAVVALIAGGLVVAFGGGDDDTIVPASETPQPDVTSPTAPDPTVVETVLEPSPSTSVDDLAGTRRPAVDLGRRGEPAAADRARRVRERAARTRPERQRCERGDWDGIVVKQPNTDFVTLIGPPDVTVQQVPVPAEINSIVAGPGPVIYGLGGPVFDDDNQAVPRGFRFVAVPFLGDRVGEVVAETEVGLNDYLELPPFFFGHGPTGVIDRGRQVGRTVIEYVDETGAPLDADRRFPDPGVRRRGR